MNAGDNLWVTTFKMTLTAHLSSWSPHSFLLRVTHKWFSDLKVFGPKSGFMPVKRMLTLSQASEAPESVFCVLRRQSCQSCSSKCRQPRGEWLNKDGAHPVNLAVLRADRHGPPHLFFRLKFRYKVWFLEATLSECFTESKNNVLV